MLKHYRKSATSLIQREIGDEYVIVNTATGNVHKLNPVATCIWRNLADDSDQESLATEVVSEFGIDMQTAQHDVETFLSELSGLGLIEENS